MSNYAEQDNYRTPEEIVGKHIESCENGTNLHKWEWNGTDTVKVVNLDKPWFLVEWYMSDNFANVHAHVDMYGTDCDGGHGSSYVVKAVETDCKDKWDFEARMLRMAVSLYESGGVLTITDKDTFSWSKATEEGHEERNVQICGDWSCIEDKSTHYDQYAEMMGY